MNVFAVAATAVVAFIITNMDNFLLLLLLFSYSGRVYRRRQIVTGWYVGFAVIVAASGLGFIGGLVLSPRLIGLLGLIPIAMGVGKIIRQEKVALPRLQEERERQMGLSERSLHPLFASLLSPGTYSVAAMTVAEGGDNVSVYVPLFASSTTSELVLTLGIFFLLLGIWWHTAYALARHPAVAMPIEHLGEQILPFVFIGLGVFIVIKQGTLQLLLGITNLLR